MKQALDGLIEPDTENMQEGTGRQTNRRNSNEDSNRLVREMLDGLRRHPMESSHTRFNMGVLRINRNHPTWCGPVAVAFLTGCTVNDAAQLFANVRNRNVGTLDKYRWMHKSSQSLSGVYPGETRDVLSLLGYEMQEIEKAKGVTVETLASRRFAWDGCYHWEDKLLVSLPKHYVVTHRYLVSDNNAQHVPACEHPYGKKVVDDAWRVFEKPFAGNFAMTA